ncbi:hypothetical protein VPH35_136179 [Triticum aestivum]
MLETNGNPAIFLQLTTKPTVTTSAMLQPRDPVIDHCALRSGKYDLMGQPITADASGESSYHHALFEKGVPFVPACEIIICVLSCAPLVVLPMELALALEKMVNEKLPNLPTISFSFMPVYKKITLKFQKEIVDHELTYQMEERWANIWKCRSKNLGLQDATIGVASKAKTITHKKYEILKQDLHDAQIVIAWHQLFATTNSPSKSKLDKVLN